MLDSDIENAELTQVNEHMKLKRAYFGISSYFCFFIFFENIIQKISKSEL